MGFDAGSIEARLTVDKSSFDRDIDEAEAKAKRLEDKTVRVKVDADTGAATLKLAALEAETNKVQSSGDSAGASLSAAFGGASAMVVGISSALPLLPELAGGLMGVAGTAFNAAGGLGAFAAVGLTDINAATKASQELLAAQNAVNNARTPTAMADALIKQKALVDSLGPSTIALSQAITGLSGAWSAFAGGFTPELTRDIGVVTKLLTDGLPLLQPLIAAGAGAVSTILTELDSALKSPFAQRFMAWMAGAAEHDILAIAHAFGGFAVGVLALFQAFSPIETLVVNGLAAMASGFATWAQHLSATEGFQAFLRYVAQNGPLLTKTLGDIVMAAGHILAALMPLLPPMLRVLDFLASAIRDTPTWALTLTAALIPALWLLNGAITFLYGTSLARFIPALFGAAAGEAAVGTAAAGATPAVEGLGGAALLASGRMAGLLRFVGLLGGLSGIAALAGIAGGVYLEAKIGQQSDKAPWAQYHTTPLPNDPSFGQADTNAYNPNAVSNYNQGSTYGGQVPSGDYNTGTMNTYNPALGYAWGTATTSSGVPNYGTQVPKGPGYTVNTGETGGSTYNAQVPGTAGSYFGNPLFDQSGAGTGNPPAWQLPASAGGGGGGGGGSGTAPMNSMAALMALLGLNLGRSLVQAVTTGVDPLVPFFQTIQKNLGVAAQGIASNLQTVFTAAQQYGQQAASSLMASVTGANTVGTQSSTSVGPDGRPVLTQQSQLVGNFTNVLLTDQRWVADIKKARAMGLAPALLQQFISAGPSSIDVLDALVNGGSAGISQLNDVNAQIGSLANTYGIGVAADRYGPQMVDLLQQLIAAVKAQPGAVGQALGTVLNGTGATAQRKQFTTLSLGAASGAPARAH